ncbi:acyltransferase family protein [Nocardioides acrostichi]|uniref:Acyltransferase n=1 Tax=Nocardioides acrostichi TaxID=2784339 RepID=A0A930UZH5_9ACTN|nr:acyltransferase family protein [Nocardioides acrostichi]MBF4161890.1 acyltransferase [Nocardioides acrostichi]
MREAVRGDIQGLRALSVLVVIAAHARLPFVAGGFIGVDVFFVISGFLITGLLLRRAAAGQGLGRGLLDFYARRARRILPAALVVLVGAVVATALFLPAVRAEEIFTDAWWAAFFAANWRFALVQTDYFAADRPTSPLQHYWSLSVEEQFYVVWPVVLLVVVLLARRRGVSPVRPLAVALGAACATSLAWSVWATHASPDTAYFSTLTRAWELGAGAGLAAWVAAREGRSVTSPDDAPPGSVPRAPQTAALLGLVLVLAAVLVLDEQSPVPGIVAALPVAGAVLLLWAGSVPGGGRTLVARALSTAPMRVLGDWSYSLYLWHFPVLVIARSRFGGLDLPHLGACLVVILALSGLTYRFVEQPFRRGRMWRRSLPAVALYPATVAVLALAVVVSSHWVDHRLDRFAGNPEITTAQFAGSKLSKDPALALVQASVLAAKKGDPIPGDLVPGLKDIRYDTAPLGECDYRTGTRQLCAEGDPDADRSIVLLGDSHARAWSPAIRRIGERLGYQVYTLAYTGCPANQAFRLDPETGRRWPDCEAFIAWSLQQVQALRPDLVLVSNAPLAPVVDPRTDEVVLKQHRSDYVDALDVGLRRELAEITPYAARTVVLANTPKLPRSPGVCLTQASDLGDCLLDAETKPRQTQRGFMQLAREHGAEALDAEKWFCAQRACPAVIGKYVTMRDSEHMTTEYSEHIADSVGRALGLTSASP